MSKLLIIICSFTIIACATNYVTDAPTASNEQLCKNLAKTWLYNKPEGHTATLLEIQKRGIDIEVCGKIGDQFLAVHATPWKRNLCERVTQYYNSSESSHYQDTMDEIVRLGFADEECDVFAQEYWRRLAGKRERNTRLSSTIPTVSDQLRKDRHNQQTYPFQGGQPQTGTVINYGCYNDYQCGYGKICVKAQGDTNITGVCVTPGDQFGNKRYDYPMPKASPHDIKSCTFKTDCNIGFSCKKRIGQIYGICVKDI